MKMSTYRIGIVEDDENQVRDIRRTIKTNMPNGCVCDLEFKMYDISKSENNVILEIINDIKNHEIVFLIVDFKLLSDQYNVNGVNIIESIKKEAREFPMVILTQRRRECNEQTDMDPDKIYDKLPFFKCEEEYSKEAVEKIFKNILRYSSKTIKLETRIQQLKDKREKTDDVETIEELIKLESELDEFYPTEESEINKVFDASALKEIVKLIEKASGLLEE